MKTSQYRGRNINKLLGNWVYSDTWQLVSENPTRPCGHCNKQQTPEGHDACLGVIPSAMNACCGHGVNKEAYIQFWGGGRIEGENVFTYLSNKTNLKQGKSE